MARAALALLLALAPVAAIAQTAGAPHPTVLTWLSGQWRGTGTMLGRASEATLSVSPVLDGNFLEFSYRAGSFEGRAFYRPAPNGNWQAHWFDNRGISFRIVARAEAQTLTSEWGDAATERGRTVYRLADDGRLHVTDSVRRPDGSYRDFASHILTREQ